MKIVLLDDHTLFGTSLQNVLLGNDHIEKFYFVQTLSELYNALDCGVDFLLLLDINLNKIGVEDSFYLARELILKYKGLKLAFLSGYDRPMYRKKAILIGAKGFFSKEMSVEELVSGLLTIEKGGNVFRSEDRTYQEDITDTEILILEKAASGLSRNEIARDLNISNRTVGTHLTNIFQKLEVKNITEAVSVALEEGYIPPIY
ncbi:MAG: response regulator transcription factor [Eubacteriales bacterium]|nr:response regulator transcription factor [Eubacteriales bacterium]